MLGVGKSKNSKMLTLDPNELNRKFMQSNVSETMINSYLDISVSNNFDISFSFI